MTLAFSYVRFSSDRQQHGTSVDRQVQFAQEYAAAHGLTLDPSSYRDLGVSAFKSRNRVEGALGAFIEAVDSGKVPAGSYLLVESFDRLSRDTVDVALELFLNLTRKGITIVTLMDQQVYSSATIRENWTKLIMALAVMARANEESVTKSRRIRESYEHRRKRGEIAHNKYPSWLRKVDKTSFEVIAEKAAIVNRVFDMALEGIGTRIIARTLHKEGVPTLQWAKGWSQSLISQMLRNPAVYGEKDGNPNYYPAIMSKDKFLMTMASVRGRKWKATRSSSVPNLFAGLSFCAICGSRVRYMPNAEKNPHIRCKKADEYQECTAKTYPYHACETAFIYTMTRKAGLDISGQYIAESQSLAPAIKGEIEALKEKQRKLTKLAALADDVEAVAEELKAIQKQIDALNVQLGEADKIPLSRKEVERHRDLFDRYIKLKDEVLRKPGDEWHEELVELKRQVRVAMARLFKRIEFGVGKEGWEPTLFLTLVDGTRATVNVTPFLHHISLAHHKRHKVEA